MCVYLWRGVGLALGHLLLLVRTRFSKVLAARGGKGQIPPRHSGQVPAASGLALSAPGQCPWRSGGGSDGGHLSLSIDQGLLPKQFPKHQQILSRLWASLVADRKESACDGGDPGSTPGSGRCPEGGNAYPLQCSFLGKSRGQRSLVGCSSWGCKD